VPQFSANITFLFRDLPLIQRFQAARDAGFTAVEILLTEGVTVDELAQAARNSGVKVVLCNAPGGDFMSGGAGLSAVPGRQAEFRQAIAEARDMAVALQCPCVHIGPSRVPPGISRPDCMEVYLENAAFAARTLADAGITATIEALNPIDNPGIFLDQFELAAEVLEQLAEPSLRLQFDVYHVARSGKDCQALLAAHNDRIAHLQFADVPGRGEPGSGQLDFAGLFRKLDELAYAGWAGAEYHPTGATLESLEWFQPYRQ
jgi:hydroxypyruvate isomerase